MTMHASKASWLALVRDSSLSRYVPGFTVITATEWLAQSRECLTQIQQQFAGTQLAVRSSKHNEAAGLPGQAGRYRSCGPVDAANRVALRRAIESVFESYGDLHSADEVMVQVWVADSTATIGVTSADAKAYGGTATLSYYTGESTNAITAGCTSAGTCDLQRDVLVLHRAPEQTAVVREVTDLAPPDDPSRGNS